MKEFMKEGVRISKGCMIIQVPTNQPKNPKPYWETKVEYTSTFWLLNILVHVIQNTILLNWELIDWELLCQHWKNNLDLHTAVACMIQKLMFSASLSCSENQDDDSSELIFR